MIQICGFLDKENNFHKTEDECKKSNLKIDIYQTERVLDNFSNTIKNYIFRSRNWGHSIDLEYSFHESEIKDIIANCVLLYSDDFIKIINKKTELEKTLDLLKKEKEYQNKWWIKVTWWK